MSELGTALAGSAASGGFGIIGNLLNFATNSLLAAQQNAYNINMWKMQAAYNSPQAQMQRFKDAGLNPNLVYGQGSNGNMSTAPQMVTPQAPELSKPMQELGKAFHIENLRTMVANRKKAEAEADNAKTDAERNSLELFAEKAFGGKYAYDYKTGKYVERPRDVSGEVTVIHPSAYFMNRLLEGNYNRAHLITPREQYINAQRAYLVPQIQMLNYERRFQPYSYWIGQGSKVLNSLTSIPATFSPLKWSYPKRGLRGNY